MMFSFSKHTAVAVLVVSVTLIGCGGGGGEDIAVSEEQSVVLLELESMGADVELGDDGMIQSVEFDEDTTDDDLEILAKVPTVTHVVLQGKGITRDAFEHLEVLEGQLVSLEISATKIKLRDLVKYGKEHPKVALESDLEPEGDDDDDGE